VGDIAVEQMRVQPAEPLPATYKQLVARGVGASFREAATVEEAALKLPQEGQVQ
jgi:hypothetical protein